MQVLANMLRTFNVAPPNRPGQETRRGRGGAALARLRHGSAPERKVYTEADDPKNLVEIDRDLHTRDGALSERQASRRRWRSSTA